MQSLWREKDAAGLKVAAHLEYMACDFAEASIAVACRWLRR
jgi:hypothetical protein